MRRFLFFFLLMIASAKGFGAPDDVVGFWKTVDDKTGKVQSIVAVYPYQGKVYGRLIITYSDETGELEDTIYNAKSRAPGVVGDPYYAGLDIMWGLKPEGDRYTDGEILDPKRGRVYGAEIWRKGDELVVRGKVFFLGRNQVWPPAKDTDFPEGFKKPDLEKLTPTIPKPKRKR